MEYNASNEELMGILKSHSVKQLKKEGLDFLQILNSCIRVNKAGKEKYKDDTFAQSQNVHIYVGFYKDVASDLGVELTPALDTVLSHILSIAN